MNVRTGFNLDFSPTRAANRFAAEQMIRRGEIKADAIRARDRGLESGLSKIVGAAFMIPSLMSENSGLSLDDAKAVLTDASREAATGRAIDPGQLMSANNLVEKEEDSQYKNFLKELFG